MNRSGIVTGEGSAALVLESPVYARARGARILAEVTGCATLADSYHPSSPDPATLPDDFDAAAAASQGQRDIPGLLDVFEPDNPGMHTSDTVDVDFVLTGEVDVELDDGVEIHLKAGDVLVPHGTRHAWRNKSAEPCVLVVAVTGARRA